MINTDMLKKLHDEIKKHPYRLFNNKEDLSGYIDLLKSFSKIIYSTYIAYCNENDINNLNVCYGHDFARAVSHLNYYGGVTELAKKHPERLQLIEITLSEWHRFLETGELFILTLYDSGAQIAISKRHKKVLSYFKDFGCLERYLKDKFTYRDGRFDVEWYIKELKWYIDNLIPTILSGNNFIY